MQKVCVYDKKGNVADAIGKMEFWNQQEDFVLSEKVEEKAQLTQSLCTIQPDICILVNRRDK